MKYLTEDQILDSLSRGKTVEAIIGKYEINGYPTIQWLAIEKGRDKKHMYYVVFHHVFDEKSEGLDSIYDFSYVEPDDMYGKIVSEFESYNDALQFSNQKFSESLSQFVSEGYIDELIN
ncbi:hypothetical protein MM213_19530 [Belliella sp. R4-6]|uniref:Uncharacterized protein n=1 Tax=Belliella alkalica TaxID=1730871 RepID=A0ABS9VGY8_9BACT|nr:hypothetical protein [Belliella alkalica]MCH7415701.1 hypothetical protein [Belliella alkalica]